MKYAFVFCLILSVLGCNKKTSVTTMDDNAQEKEMQQTSHSSSDTVDALVASNRVESPYVGKIGTPSKQHNRFIDLRDNSTEEELLQLLKHENRVVKYYAFRALRENGNRELKTYYKQMADDQGMVQVINGDVIVEISLPMLLKQEMAKGAARSEKAVKQVKNNPDR